MTAGFASGSGGLPAGVPRALRSGAPRRAAVFIDKDGTLVRNVPYNVDPALLEFTAHAPEALRLLDGAGYAIVVVTNQPGLALGRFTRHQFVRLEAALKERVLAESGVCLTALVCCPHAPREDGRPACLCRKPAPGMLHQAILKHGLDAARSWMVGDILDDVEAGRLAGCRTVLLDVGNETEWKLSPMRRPDATCADLLQAARIVVGTAQRTRGAEAGASEQPS